jgi:hypothetical protein
VEAENVEIYDAFYDAGYYSDELGNTWQYTLRIPGIRAAGPEAARISQQMVDDLMPAVQDAQEAMAGQYSLIVSGVDYTIHLNGELISIVAVVKTDWGFDNYYVYRFDAASRTIIDRSALLSRFGMTEEDFLALAAGTVEAYFQQNYSNVPRDDFWADRYEKSTARENFTNDCQLYVDDDGKLCMIARLYSFAGADYYYHSFPLT